MNSDTLFARLVRRLRPEYDTLSPLERVISSLDVFTLLYTVPLALLGLAWLVASSSYRLTPRDWLTLLMLLVLGLLFRRYAFQVQVQIRKGAFAEAGGSLENLVTWSAALIFGPVAVWVPVLGQTAVFGVGLLRSGHRSERWNQLRVFVSSLAGETLATLSGLWVYTRLGGTFPIAGLGAGEFIPALLASLVLWLVLLLLTLPMFIYITRLSTLFGEGSYLSGLQTVRFFLLAGLGFYLPLYPFAILAAGLYARHGIGIYLLFVTGALLFSLLTSRLSDAVRRSDQRARELATLEKLGQAIIATPPDETRARLPELLQPHAEQMLPHARIYIWLFPDEVLVEEPANKPVPQIEQVRGDIAANADSHHVYRDIILPQGELGKLIHNGLAVPILHESGTVLGGIYVLQRPVRGELLDSLAALQSLASQVALALRRAEVYEQRVASERMAQELAVAGKIQSSFLPSEVPHVPGWQLAARLVPARQTSGDFYDFIRLENGRLGIVVADVADKGTGAALYMALSRTLIRTYALAYPDRPEEALRATNERLRSDAASDQFVTVFYAVLEPETGLITYCNAGHNPAYVLSPNGPAPQALIRTGIPLGMFEGMTWERRQLELSPGSTLLLYTDGVTEAQNETQELFDDQRLLATSREHLNGTAVQLQNAIVTAVQQFTHPAPQFDDITLVILSRS